MFSGLSLTAYLLLIPQGDWTWRTFPENGFKIFSPVELTHQVTEVPTPVSIIQFHQYHGGSLADTAQALAFVIDHYVLPGDEELNEDGYIQEFFESTIDELLTSIDGHLVYSDILHQADRDVCVWKADYMEGKGVIRGHVILSGSKYFGLQVFGLEKNKPDDDMVRFLDSFKMIQ